MTSTDLDVPFDGCRSERADSPGARHDARAAVAARWRMLGTAPRQREALADERTLAELAAFERNIENFIGTVKVPIGIAGPLRVRGTSAQGEYYLPLATTEAALVASYSRGAQLVTAAGGCTAAGAAHPARAAATMHTGKR